MTPEPTSSPTAAPAAAPSAATAFWSRLSQGEQLALAGAATLVVIGNWLLADLLGLGGAPIEVELAAAEIALLIYARAMKPGTTWPIPYAMILGGTAAVLVIPTIGDILETFRNTSTLDGGLLLGLLVNWIAALAVGVGAWMVWRSDSR
ncbi:MAG TPA: hypothetical protein VFW20_03355 [Candidatus Limnocylindrales bacterium]|nr:hypothetical protein [Candidatus Limnocylindrales bacterium]